MGDLNYAVDIIVSEYWYDRAAEQFTTTEPPVAAYSDFKLMVVNVDWDEGAEFIIDETKTTAGRLGFRRHRTYRSHLFDYLGSRCKIRHWWNRQIVFTEH